MGTRSGGTAKEPPQMASWKRALAKRLSDTCSRKVWTFWIEKETKVCVRDMAQLKTVLSHSFGPPPLIVIDFFCFYKKMHTTAHMLQTLKL